MKFGIHVCMGQGITGNGNWMWGWEETFWVTGDTYAVIGRQSNLVANVLCLVLLITGKEHGKIKHSWDVWHGAKNLGRKLNEVGYIT